MTRRDFEARSAHCENGEVALLLYYILEETLEGCMSYGAEIVMHRGGHRETAAVRHITTSYGRMREILSLLSRNTVTPCTLREIVEEEVNKF